MNPDFTSTTAAYVKVLSRLGQENVELDATTAKQLRTMGRTSPSSASQKTETVLQPSRSTPTRSSSAPVVVTPRIAEEILITPSGSKDADLATLNERAQACLKCSHLVKSRHHVVFGEGNPNADIMFVGEAPGEDEDLGGRPFIGRAGQLLTKMIEAMAIKREDVYIGNVLKCRPDMPAGVAGNRKPTPSEMETCLPYLRAQIAIVQPKVIVTLGATAFEGLTSRTKISMTSIRGVWHEFSGIPLMPTYHPAYLLRDQSIAKKRIVWEDLLAVMEKVELPISTKQRNFFLR